jgi:hypothetical protein
LQGKNTLAYFAKTVLARNIFITFSTKQYAILLTNIRPTSKSLPRGNTLTYFAKETSDGNEKFYNIYCSPTLDQPENVCQV